MRLKLVLLAGSLPLMIPQPGSAQGPASSVVWQRPAPLPATPVPAAAVSVARAPDHRWEGMAIGAGVGAVAFALLWTAVCAQSDTGDSCTGPVIGVGLLGAFAGGVTGGAFPKGEPADTTEAD